MAAGWAEINGVGGGYRVGRYREFAVTAALTGTAEVGWHFLAAVPTGRSDAVERILPETGVSLTVECRRGRLGRVEDLELSLMGPITATRFFQPPPDTEMTGIRIRPEWCPALFGLGAGEIRDGLLHAPRAGWTDSLRLRLARSCDAIQVTALLSEALIARRPPDSLGASTLVAHRALERLRRRDAPPASLRALAREFGLSPRHVRRVVRDNCGFGIKWFQRVRRFHRAVSAAAGVREPCWPALAADTGYYDQAHMIHEFRALSGLTPVELVAERAERRAR